MLTLIKNICKFNSIFLNLYPNVYNCKKNVIHNFFNYDKKEIYCHFLTVTEAEFSDRNSDDLVASSLGVFYDVIWAENWSHGVEFLTCIPSEIIFNSLSLSYSYNIPFIKQNLMLFQTYIPLLVHQTVQ